MSANKSGQTTINTKYSHLDTRGGLYHNIANITGYAG